MISRSNFYDLEIMALGSPRLSTLSLKNCVRSWVTEVTGAGPAPKETDVETALVTSTWPLPGDESS